MFSPNHSDMGDKSNINIFKHLDDMLNDYEYYEEVTTTLKPDAEVVNSTGGGDPVTTLVNETNRLMLDLNNKYLEAADEV